ncbi:histidine-type phosphatase [Niabella sp.]|uniref:histidine-type phosphatase n=1 Tax=Niabella sp. TaxID=1962976 RepID=UPI00261BDAC7|nr:histidine-type phosphatase [Niabella sp.]
MKKIGLIVSLLLFALCSLWGQTAREEINRNIDKAGGSYYAYTTEFIPQTQAPKGYKAFYISHYSRHGSRYLTKDVHYSRVIDVFAKAHEQSALTTVGEDTYKRLQEVMKEAALRAGDLSLVGKQQHRDIAKRMFTSFPEVFKQNQYISLRSTIALRCIMSMVSFGDKLKELNPGSQLDYDTGEKFMTYMNYITPEGKDFKENGAWEKKFNTFTESNAHPDRLMKLLFNNPAFVSMNVKPIDLMRGLYSIAVDMQDVETNVSFYDLFSIDELYSLWEIDNVKSYIQRANYAGGNGAIPNSEKRLLANILDSADKVIRKGGKAADLRFGHDGNISPLLALMQVNDFAVSISDFKEVHRVWRDYKVVPMATNLQIIFFRHEKNPNDILVKFLHNESEARIPVQTTIFPFYKWTAVEHFYRNLLKP